MFSKYSTYTRNFFFCRTHNDRINTIHTDTETYTHTRARCRTEQILTRGVAQYQCGTYVHDDVRTKKQTRWCLLSRLIVQSTLISNSPANVSVLGAVARVLRECVCMRALEQIRCAASICLDSRVVVISNTPSVHSTNTSRGGGGRQKDRLRETRQQFAISPIPLSFIFGFDWNTRLCEPKRMHCATQHITIR